MAKPLVLRIEGEDVPFQMEKVDRRRLYGYVETVAVDEAGDPCRLVTMAGDGHTLVGSGGTAFLYTNADGELRRKEELTPVDPAGARLVAVPSSFNAPISLLEEATPEEVLNHLVRSVYQLQEEAGIGAATKLRAELKAGRIYKFAFSYRGGLEPDAGFLLEGTDGNVFLLLGKPTDVRFVALENNAASVDEEAVEDEEESMDFGMM